MSSTDYFQHHHQLLHSLFDHCKQQPPFSAEQGNEVDMSVLNQLEQLAKAHQSNEEFIELGQNTIQRIVANYPHITPYVHRDLFWFFGGSCLHYMDDSEIENYQQLDELRFNSEAEDASFDYHDARAKVFGLH